MEKSLSQKKVAFGLTAKQLVSVHDQLGKTVGTPTKGKNVGDLANSLLRKSGYQVSMGPDIKLMISAAQSKMEYELEEFSIGTSLALSLREMGLVFEPKRPQGKTSSTTGSRSG